MSGSPRQLKPLVAVHTIEKLSAPAIPLQTLVGERLAIPESGYLKLIQYVQDIHGTTDLTTLSLEEMQEALAATNTKLTRYLSEEQRKALLIAEASEEDPWENITNQSGVVLPKNGKVSLLILNNDELYVSEKIDPVAGDFSGKIQKVEGKIDPGADEACRIFVQSDEFKARKRQTVFIEAARSKLAEGVAAASAAHAMPVLDEDLKSVLDVSEGRVKIKIPGTIGLNHSSVFAGEPVQFSGALFYVEGKGWVLENKTGHYRTDSYSFISVLKALESKGYDLSGLSILARFPKPGLQPSGCGELGKYYFELAKADQYLANYEKLRVEPPLGSTASISPAGVASRLPTFDDAFRPKTATLMFEMGEVPAAAAEDMFVASKPE